MKLKPYYDILLVKKSKSFWANLVRFILRDKNGYMHSEYFVDPWHTVSTDLMHPVRIREFGFNISDIDIWRYNREISDEQIDMIVEELQKDTKISYNLIEAIYTGFRLKYKSKSKKHICISLIVDAMNKAGLFPDINILDYHGFEIFTDSGFFTKQ